MEVFITLGLVQKNVFWGTATMHFQKSDLVKQLSAMMDTKYISVRFMDNDSRRWDGKVSDFLLKTVVQTGCCNEEGMEEAEVHGPSRGKEKER